MKRRVPSGDTCTAKGSAPPVEIVATNPSTVLVRVLVIPTAALKAWVHPATRST
jgi:hypothetical protein